MFEVKRKMAEDVRIHYIVIGLSIDIGDKIEKEIVQSTNDLMGILGQYEDQRKRKETQERKVNLDKKAMTKTNYFCNIGDKIRYFCLKTLTKLIFTNKFINRYNN